MPEVRFYHLLRQDLEQVLPQLLEKSLERGWKAVVRLGSEERVEHLSAHLWTYRDDGFLPHGSAEDPSPELQPIFLTSEPERPNGASVLFLADGTDTEAVGDYTLVCYLFDGRDEDSVRAHRRRWKSRKAEGFALTYWQQSERGGWIKKAEEAATADGSAQ